jgi:Flp pilus assembly protein TadD
MTPELIDQVLSSQITLSQALGLSESVVEVFAILGAQCYQQGRYGDARSMFVAAIALNGNSYFGHAGLGAVALVEDDFESALQSLQRAYRINAQDPAVCGNLGEVMLRKGQLPEAVRYLSEAAALDPAHTNPYANRARGILHAIQPQPR